MLFLVRKNIANFALKIVQIKNVHLKGVERIIYQVHSKIQLYSFGHDQFDSKNKYNVNKPVLGLPVVLLRSALWVIIIMADGTKTVSLASAPCHYQPLKLCLEQNNGDRNKCKKELEEFQRSCAENKS